MTKNTPIPLPSKEELHHLFSYNMETGELFWKNHPSPMARSNGKRAGSYSTKGRKCPYVDIKINGVTYKGHRLVWKYVYGVEPPIEIDHVDGNHQNNRIDNLREHPTHNQHNRIETRHLPEPLRVTINGVKRWTDTGKKVLKEYKRTGVWNPHSSRQDCRQNE